MRIKPQLAKEIVAHAREDAPNECCGIVGFKDGRAATVYRARNRFSSPMRFEIHPEDMIRIFNRTEEQGEEVGILYHSHPRSEAYPSQTDVNLAANVAAWWPEIVWAICSLADSEPQLRAFRINDGAVEEVALDVS